MDSKVVVLLCTFAVFGAQSRPNHCLCPDEDVEKELKALWDFLGSKKEATLPGELSPWVKCPKCDKNVENDLEFPEEVEDRKKREENDTEDDFSSEDDSDVEEHESAGNAKDVEIPEEDVEKKQEKRDTHLNTNCPPGQRRVSGVWCVDVEAFLS